MMDSDRLLLRTMLIVGPGPPLLRVLQWNVLSDQLAVNFPKVADHILDWNYRQPLLKAELTRADADLVCLEEVDRFEDLAEFLEPKGYQSVFVKKGGWHSDGTAIFFRAKTLEMIDCQSVSFREQKQFYLLARLRHKSLDVEFAVVATHLKSYPKYESIRLAQIQQILYHLGMHSTLPMILVGDLNSTPFQDVYSRLKFSHLGLQSVYWNTINPVAEPKYTNYTYRETLEICTLDYIWVKGWKPCAVMSIPSPEEIGINGLPCERYPSDHIALVCDLTLPIRL